MSHEHYYTPNPTSEIHEKQLSFQLDGKQLSFLSVSGVFGLSTYVDKASQLLIHAFHPSGKEMLDLGCGFGAIGLSIKTRFPETKVTMTDINTRAVEYSQRNALKNNLNVHILASDLFQEMPDSIFNDIISNPPIAMGKPFLARLVDECFTHISSGGALWLVAFHNKGGSTLKAIMHQRFGNASDEAKGGGIRVYKSIKE